MKLSQNRDEWSALVVEGIKLNILSATRDLVHLYVLGDVIDIKL